MTRKIPTLLVAEERPALLPLGEPYDTDEVRSVIVPPTFRVAFDGNRYSVPWRLVGKPLTLRADADTVTLWYGTHRVARHGRCWRRGVEVVLPATVEAALAACLAQVIVASQHVEQWLRLQDTPPAAPPPLTLGVRRLAVPPVRPNLQRSDALLLEANREAHHDDPAA